MIETAIRQHGKYWVISFGNDLYLHHDNFVRKGYSKDGLMKSFFETKESAANYVASWQPRLQFFPYGTRFKIGDREY